MARRRFLIAYDIAHPRRLRLTCKVMEGYGDRLQYSVFLCDLSDAEFAQWERDIRLVIDLGEDSIVVIDIGTPLSFIEPATTREPSAAVASQA